MNHLAHLFLARTSEEWMVGGFIADAVKGKKYQEFDKGIEEGILLHRFIDTYTDANPIVHQSKSHLREKFGLLSGIIVDVFYDHFLAKNWSDYSSESLEDFTLRCYKVFEKYISKMPERNQRMFPYMQKENWLLSYAHLSGIRRSLEGMSRRITIPNKLYEAPDALLKHYDEFEKEFREFFPLLQLAVEKRINQLLGDSV